MSFPRLFIQSILYHLFRSCVASCCLQMFSSFAKLPQIPGVCASHKWFCSQMSIGRRVANSATMVSLRHNMPQDMSTGATSTTIQLCCKIYSGGWAQWKGGSYCGSLAAVLFLLVAYPSSDPSEHYVPTAIVNHKRAFDFLRGSKRHCSIAESQLRPRLKRPHKVEAARSQGA